MNLVEFQNLNIAAGDKNKLVNAFNQANPSYKCAFFWDDRKKHYYYATSGGTRYDPVFKLFGCGRRNIDIKTNYDCTSESAKGVLELHKSKCEKHTPSMTNSYPFIKGKNCFQVEINVQAKLKNLYKLSESISPVVSDIQSESASVKDKSGKYTTCGMRTVHRLYLATAYVILRKLHSNPRDGVVALIVGKDGRIISWGRKNNDVSCWHGETSAIMGLGGKIPAGACVFSTLKPCKMCSGLIHDASGGSAKVFWGQDDPGPMAKNTILEVNKTGQLLDGNKNHHGARAVLLGHKSPVQDQRKPMSDELGDAFKRQDTHRSTIDYIVTDEAATIIKSAEQVLKSKYRKYEAGPDDFNENTEFALRYLMGFLAGLGLRPDGLGV